MIVISKDERNYLESKGLRMGKDMFRSHSKHPKYYLVEAPKAVRILYGYRKDSVVESVEQTRSGKILRKNHQNKQS